jgi:clorobiocin biosynthesis protein CloN4
VSLHRYVIDAAATAPHRPAVVGACGALTYGELDGRANALARRLRALGIGPADRVVIWAPKSAATVVGLQAVLRLGAAYVPAEGDIPVRRVAVMTRHCGARAVLATADRIPAISAELGPAFLCADLSGQPGYGTAPVNVPVQPDDLAYILYTSGSTGTPKGVCISHRNAVAFVDWAAAELGARPTDRFANHAPFTFDLSVLDLYAAFAAGASVHLVPAELGYAPAQLTEFLAAERISVWYSVPSALTLMMRDGGLLGTPAPPELRAVLFAGEPFPVGQVRRLAGWTSARLLNLYGPTETNVCAFHQVTPADLERDRPVPIGTAACGDRIWAQRPDGSLCGPGDEGELMVDGPTVMLGYWGQPAHRGPYPTGDIVRVLPGGSLDYSGRVDTMVKVRGHRIELSEIEAVLAAHPGVEEAAATTVGDGIDGKLVAFVVPVPGHAPGILALKRHSAQQLPRYMIADEIHLVGELHRTRNGKIDRSALLARYRAARQLPGSLHGQR